MPVPPNPNWKNFFPPKHQARGRFRHASIYEMQRSLRFLILDSDGYCSLKWEELQAEYGENAVHPEHKIGLGSGAEEGYLKERRDRWEANKRARKQEHEMIRNLVASGISRQRVAEMVSCSKNHIDYILSRS